MLPKTRKGRVAVRFPFREDYNVNVKMCESVRFWTCWRFALRDACKCEVRVSPGWRAYMKSRAGWTVTVDRRTRGGQWTVPGTVRRRRRRNDLETSAFASAAAVLTSALSLRSSNSLVPGPCGPTALKGRPLGQPRPLVSSLVTGPSSFCSATYMYLPGRSR